MADQKLYRFADGTVSTMREWCIKNAVRYEMKTNRSWFDLIDRRKHHRMNNEEQAEYEKKLKIAAAKPQYRAWTNSDTCMVITKREYLAAISGQNT